MRVYVAAKFEEATRARGVMAELEIAGHTITHDWTGEDIERFPRDAAYRQRCAEEDLRGVRTADAVVVLNHPLLFGGAAEMGMACLLGLPVYVVGRHIRENIFYNLPNVVTLFDDADVVPAIEATRA